MNLAARSNVALEISSEHFADSCELPPLDVAHGGGLDGVSDDVFGAPRGPSRAAGRQLLTRTRTLLVG